MAILIKFCFTALCVIDAELLAKEFHISGKWICADTQVSVAGILDGSFSLV